MTRDELLAPFVIIQSLKSAGNNKLLFGSETKFWQRDGAFMAMSVQSIAPIMFGNQPLTAKCFNVDLINCREFDLPGWNKDDSVTHSWHGWTWGPAGTDESASSLGKEPQRGQLLLAPSLLVTRCSEGLRLRAEFQMNCPSEPDMAREVQMVS